MEWSQLTKEEMKYALNCTRGTLAMEGLELPREIERIYKKLLRGEITKEQSTEEILKYHGMTKE